MKTISKILIILLFLNCSNSLNLDLSDDSKTHFLCKNYNNFYFTSLDSLLFSEYDDCVKKDSTLLTNAIKKNFENCFCDSKLKGFKNIVDNRKEKVMNIKIEPLIVDINKCTGIYACMKNTQKVYGVRYFDEDYINPFIHDLFIINNNEIISTKDLDDEDIEDIISNSSSEVSAIFDKKELLDIRKYAKFERINSPTYTILPELIKDKGEVVYDVKINCK